MPHQSPPSPVPKPFPTTTHWLHKSSVQLLSDFNATYLPSPSSDTLEPTSINLHLYIKYRPSIYAVQNGDGVITVPWFWINPIQNPRAGQRPLSELILEHLTPAIRTASITAPQFLEFRFEWPLVECVDVFEEGKENEDEREGDGGEGEGRRKRKRDDGNGDGEGAGLDGSDVEETDDSGSDDPGESSDESGDESEEDDSEDEDEEDDGHGDGEEDDNEPIKETSKKKPAKAKPVAKVLLMAVIMGVSAANRDWVMLGWKKRAWFRDTNPWVLEQLVGGQVVERLKQMGAERSLLTTLADRNLVRVEILRSLGHLIRVSESAQNITHPCVAILEPVDIVDEARETTGLMLLDLSAERMDTIQRSQKVMHADGRVPACIWAVVGWFDRRHHQPGEAVLMESEWSMKRFFLENGRNKSAWLQFRHGDPQEFLVESENMLPEVFRWDVRSIMPV